MRKKTISGRNIFIFWGRDIPYLEQFLLSDNYDNIKYSKLIYAPADIQAIQWMSTYNIPCILLDSLISKDKKNFCFNRAKNITIEWVKKFRRDDISSYFHFSLLMQLTTIYTALSVAKALLQLKIDKLYVFHYIPEMLNDLWDTVNLPQCVWKDVLSTHYKPIFVDYNNSKPYSTPSLCCDPIDHIAYSNAKDSFIFFSRSACFYRDKRYMSEISSRMRLCYMLDKSDRPKKEILANLNFPLLFCGQSFKKNLTLNKECMSWILDKLIEFPSTHKIISTYLVEKHREYSASAEWLKNAFMLYRPKGICIPQNAGIRFRYIEQACIDIDIPLVSVPHSAYQEPRMLKVDGNSHYISLYVNQFHHKFANYNILSARSTSIDTIFTHSEYKAKQIRMTETGRRKLLFILDSSQFYPSLVYFDGPAERIKLFRSIKERKDLCKYDILIKFHPAWPEFPLWEIAGGNKSEILPLDSDLNDLMQITHMAVSYNYASAPTHIAIMNDVPILHCNTTKTNKSIRYYTSMEESLIENNFLFAYSIEEMWCIIDNIFNNNKLYNSILSFQNNFKQHLCGELNISFSEFINNILNKSYIDSFPMEGNAVNFSQCST